MSRGLGDVYKRQYIWTAEEPIELQKGVEHTLTLNVNETARLATMQMKYRATGQIIDQK